METHEDFLAPIYAEPEADEPRLAYMRWLLERGNPRGKFLELQYASYRGEELDGKALRRERKLFREHQVRWLGKTLEILRAPVFERGFLASASVCFASREHLDATRDATLSTLVEAAGPMNDIEALLFADRNVARLRPNLRALRRVRIEDHETDGVGRLMEVVAGSPQLQRVTLTPYGAAALERRGEELVFHLDAASASAWHARLAAVDGRGWTLEVTSSRYTERAHREDAQAAAPLASLRSFRYRYVQTTKPSTGSA